MMARFGIESMHGVRDAENNDRLLGITGLSENLGRDNGIEKPYWANEDPYLRAKSVFGICVHWKDPKESRFLGLNPDSLLKAPYIYSRFILNRHLIGDKLNVLVHPPEVSCSLLS